MTSAIQNNIKFKTLPPLVCVLVLFVVSRVIYNSAGILFEGDTYLGHWHFIDVKLLKTDLIRNVYYLHSQPPLLNLFTGIILQTFPANHDDAFNLIFYLAGLIFATSLYFLGNILGLRPWTSAIIAGLFIISPSAILYENWLSYSFMLAAIMTLAGLFLHEFAQTKKTIWGFLFFLMLAGLALTWSLFHIVWLYVITIVLLFLFPRNRKKISLAALIPVLLVTGWYAKNLILYREFTASSWAGMNLANITTFRISEKERKALQRSGELSELATIFTFRNPVVYLKLFPDTPLTGIPVLDEPEPNQINHHHLVYVEASRYYLKDALKIIRLHPYTYLQSIGQATYIYFHSTSDFDFLYGNRQKIGGFDLWWNRLFYGQWGVGEKMEIRMTLNKSIQNVGWLVVAAFLVSLVSGVCYLYNNARQLSKPRTVLVLFMLYNILFVTVIGNMMEIGENNRFRFVIDPFILVLFVFFMRDQILPTILEKLNYQSTKTQ